jgi:hypothetical protein
VLLELVVPVAAPPADVFVVLADLRRVPDWMTETIAAVEPAGTAWAVAESVAPSRLRFTGPAATYGPLAAFQVGAGFDIVDAGPGHSIVRGGLEVRAGRGLRLVAPLVARRARALWARDLGRLAALAEAQAGTAATRRSGQSSAGRPVTRSPACVR